MTILRNIRISRIGLLQKIRNKCYLFGICALAVFLTSCSTSEVEINLAPTVAERAFDIPTTNDAGTSIALNHDTTQNDDDLKLIIKKPDNGEFVHTVTEAGDGNSTLVAKAIITPTKRAAVFYWRSDTQDKLFSRFTEENLSSLDYASTYDITKGTANPEINLATNKDNYVVAAFNYGIGVPEMDDPVSQFMVFKADGTTALPLTTGFAKSEFHEETTADLPRIAIDNDKNILIAQAGSGKTYWSYFKHSENDGNDDWSLTNGDALDSEFVVTCKATMQGLFLITSDKKVTTDDTLSTENTLKFYSIVTASGNLEERESSTGNALTTDVVQYWSPPTKSGSSNVVNNSKSFYITSISGTVQKPSGSKLSANGFIFSDPASLPDPVNPAPTIVDTTGKANQFITSFTGGTLASVGISNGYLVGSITGSLWIGLGNFTTGEVSYVVKASDTQATNAQASVGPNGEATFFWTDSSGNTQTYPASVTYDKPGWLYQLRQTRTKPFLQK